MPVKATLPAGKYYIGDPCYAVPNDGPKSVLWGDICDEMFGGGGMTGGPNQSVSNIPGVLFWAESTAYGDGTYFADGYEFPVDSGLLGIMPWSTVEFFNRADFSATDSGAVIEFDEPFEIEFRDGRFKINHTVIDTGYDEDLDDGGYDDDVDDDYEEEDDA